MIYLNTAAQSQAAEFPLQGAVPTDLPSLTARSTVDNKSVTFGVRRCEVFGSYARLVLVLPDGIYTGEWEYRLAYPTAAGEEVLTGLLVVTEDPAPQPVRYEKKIEYKQYGN